jgi:DNA invertase Pin-like site-specific DNA recombinase
MYMMYNNMENEKNTTVTESESEITCLVCDDGNDGDCLLLCDKCNKGYHTFCLNMTKVPNGSWYCPKCIRQTNNFKSKTVIKPNKNAHVYIRISTSGQNAPEYGRVGKEIQNNTILSYCATNDLNVKSTTVEVGSAWKTGKNPKLDVLINKINKGDQIIVFSCSRISRNVDEYNKRINKIHNKEGFVYSITENVNSINKDFIEYVKGAQNESKMMSERACESHKRIVEKGGYTGRTKPFGYTIFREADGIKKLKENVIEQKIMIEIRDINSEKDYKKKHLLKKVSDKYPKYTWSVLNIERIIDDYYAKNWEIVKGNLFVSDMIDSLPSAKRICIMNEK